VFNFERKIRAGTGSGVATRVGRFPTFPLEIDNGIPTTDPPRVLKAQADNIAAMLKAFERGEKIDSPFAAKLEAARGRDCLKFVVVMDDKVLTIEMPWATIRETSEAGISEYIVKQMPEARDSVN
jgi:hypothetical protein